MKAPIIYIPGAVENPADVLKNLSEGLRWEKRDSTPRQEYYCNEFPEPYTYGSGRGVRTYNPQLWTEDIVALQRLAEFHARAKLEVCFLNRYLDQSDQLGWHADDSPEMDDERPIVIISLGVEREIWFRPKQSPDGWRPAGSNFDIPSNYVEKLKLGHGSLCIMQPGMQDTWQHRIPKASFQCGERISLTFRGYVKPFWCKACKDTGCSGCAE